MSKSELRLALEAAVDERHCADHPMWDKLAAGELGRNGCMGWAVEHYHWISNMLTEATFQICSKAPADVIELELENFHEEEDPDEPHMEIVLQFAEANGADLSAVRTGEGLPTTRSWAAWLKNVAREGSGIAASPRSASARSRNRHVSTAAYCRRCERTTDSTKTRSSISGYIPRSISNTATAVSIFSTVIARRPK